MAKRVLVGISLLIVTGIVGFLLIGNNRLTVQSNVIESGKISYNFQVRPILSDKCFACHGPDAEKREAGLRLDVEEDAFKVLKESPGAYALVKGHPERSELFLRISSVDSNYIMPPPASHLAPLTTGEIDLIRQWIKQGANYERHWAFQPPVKATLPTINDKQWPRNEIDHFVLAEMTRQRLSPNDEAEKQILLKRICQDITGLPPSPAQIRRFMSDDSPEAYEKMIDELLKSASYGERMAAPWLDVARYADSHGYQDDAYRSHWPYRDWVIHAFNQNLPYDKFLTWQLAGDLIPEATKEHLLATTFNRNHKITEEGGVIDEEYRVSYVLDRTNTLGRAVLGVTVECAQCHDHKYDPISQKEYFQLYAFFNNIGELGLESVIGGPRTWAKNPRMEITREDISNLLYFINNPDTGKVEVSVMKERDTLRKTFVLGRGNYDDPQEEVLPGTPASILTYDERFAKNRKGLADWLFDEKNPLTARVFVNRLWQDIFGRGIVASVADFGMQGDLPSHPQLLDWLAVDFMENGWDIKQLLKKMLMSATYRQSAVVTPEKLNADPSNVYLSRAPRLRLTAEAVRDMVLFSSGLMDRTIGGPSVKPYQPPGIWEIASSGRGSLTTYKQDTGTKLYRRGIYTFIKRTVPPPSLLIFDGSNRDECQVSRPRTNTPLQAFVMMNDITVQEASRALADRMLQSKLADSDIISEVFLRIVGRNPDNSEHTVLANYWKDQKEHFHRNKEKASQLMKAGEYRNQTRSEADVAALMLVVQAVYNLDEAITKT